MSKRWANDTCAAATAATDWSLAAGAARNATFLPGLGLLALAGPVVAARVGALEGAVVVGGFSALGAALMQNGVLKEQVIKYETAIKVDKYVLLVHGSAEDAAKARGILEASSEWQKAA